MYDTNELCEKIRDIYPEIGECGGEVDVEYDKSKDAYIVALSDGDRNLKTHLEPADAGACIEGEQCVSLGVQVAQLVENSTKS